MKLHDRGDATSHGDGGNAGGAIVLTPEHWAATLSFAHDVGMRVTLNLNCMHGREGRRWPGYGVCGTANASEPFPPWNGTQSEALLRWTVANVPQDRWPAWVGLGNEKTGLIPSTQYVEDLKALQLMLSRIFPSSTVAHTPNRALVPQIYAPCGCSMNLADPGLGSVGFLDAVNAASQAVSDPLQFGAFSWHSYPQLCKRSTPQSEQQDLLGGGGLLATARYYDHIAQTLAAHPPGQGRSWITESAYSCAGPANASLGGASAAVDSMLRAVDMTW